MLVTEGGHGSPGAEDLFVRDARRVVHVGEGRRLDAEPAVERGAVRAIRVRRAMIR